MRQPMKYNDMNLSTDAFDRFVAWGFTAHIHVPGAEAPAADTTSVLAATALTATTQTITTGITNPGVPRSVQVVGNTAGMTGNVTVKGTAYDGSAISETFALNGTTTVAGTAAFATVTEIDLPVQTGAGDTVSVGAGDALGIPYKLTVNTVQFAVLNGAKEGTAPTVSVDPTNIQNNTVTLASALDAHDVDVYLIVG